jgi:hypothetical protein
MHSQGVWGCLSLSYAGVLIDIYGNSIAFFLMGLHSSFEFAEFRWIPHGCFSIRRFTGLNTTRQPLLQRPRRLRLRSCRQSGQNFIFGGYFRVIHSESPFRYGHSYGVSDPSRSGRSAAFLYYTVHRRRQEYVCDVDAVTPRGALCNADHFSKGQELLPSLLWAVESGAPTTRVFSAAVKDHPTNHGKTGVTIPKREPLRWFEPPF